MDTETMTPAPDAPEDAPGVAATKWWELRADGRNSLPMRMLLSGLVALCLYGILWAFWHSNTDPAVKMPSEIEALNPVQDAQTVPRQSSVTVDFQFGITGELNIDGVDIPKDETTYEKSQAILTFSPHKGAVMSLLPGGFRRATVTYWPVGTTRELAGKSFSWTFTVT